MAVATAKRMDWSVELGLEKAFPVAKLRASCDEFARVVQEPTASAAP